MLTLYSGRPVRRMRSRVEEGGGVEGAAHGGLRRQGRASGCGGVEKKMHMPSRSMADPPLQDASECPPAGGSAGRGVWFVAHQGTLDAPGQPQSQQGPHCRRQRADGRQAQGDGQRHMGQAAGEPPAIKSRLPPDSSRMGA